MKRFNPSQIVIAILLLFICGCRKSETEKQVLNLASLLFMVFLVLSLLNILTSIVHRFALFQSFKMAVRIPASIAGIIIGMAGICYACISYQLTGIEHIKVYIGATSAILGTALVAWTSFSQPASQAAAMRVVTLGIATVFALWYIMEEGEKLVELVK